MGTTLVTRLALVAVAPALMMVIAAGAARTHNDWGLPLVGGLVGGYGLSYMMNRERERDRQQTYQPQPVYVAPAAPAAAPARSAASTAASIEHQLNVLDDLAAKGYITPEEYKARREALLNRL